MNRVEILFLRKLFRKVVLQGGHRLRIIELYRIFIDVARDEFVEDARPTFNSFMRECHEKALQEQSDE